jgi:parvulin-like peptidyl-prolyl isomerase
MVNDLVQVQLAKETGIKVDDATLDKTIERIAQENNLSVTAFRSALERDGIRYPRFREDIRAEILLARLREREIDNAVVVTDAEVETELAREAREASGDSEYNLAHVLVVVQPQSNSQQIEQRRRRAAQALNELRRGANFAQVAATYSDAPDALQGGNLGWRASGRLPQVFLGAISKLQPGEVSDILRSPNGFHIVKLLEKRGRAAVAGVQQTHVRHILLRAREGLTEADARKRLQEARERIVAGTDFAEIAQAALRRRERLQGRRPRLDRPGRHRARIREGDERAQGPGGEPARADPVRVAPRAGPRAPRRRALRGPQEDRRAPGDPLAQGRRGLPGLVAADARPRVRREPLRRALARPCLRAPPRSSRSPRESPRASGPTCARSSPRSAGPAGS